MFPKFLISLFILLSNYAALSCSCHSDIEEMNIARFNDAEAIFIGRPDSIYECSITRTIDFIIKKSYKGKLSTKVTVKGIDCISSCALSFEKHQDYLIYLYKDADNNLKILPCTGTRRLLSKEETDQELKQAEKFNTLPYLKEEIDIWQHEIDFLEKMPAIKEGKIKTYYPNGQITGEGKFENGLPIGEWKYFYPDGNIKATGFYDQGKKSGKWVEYITYYATYEDTSGSERKRYLIKNSGTYDSGYKEGKWERINLDGTIQTLYYKRGKFVSEKAH